MKRKLTFCGLFICLTMICNGQKLWEKVYSERRFELSLLSSSAMVGDSMILLSGLKSFYYCDGNFMGALNVNGDEVWSIMDQHYDGDCGFVYCSGLFDKIIHSGDYIYGVGASYQGGIILDEYPLNLFKWDLEGNDVFHKWYYNENWEKSYVFNPVHLDVNNEDGMLVTGNVRPEQGVLAKFDLDGEIVWEKKYDFPITKAIFFNGKLAIIGGNRLYIANANGEISESVGFDDIIVDFEAINDRLYVSYADLIYVVRSDNYLPSWVYSSPSGKIIKQITTLGEELWIRSESDGTIFISKLTEKNHQNYIYSLPTAQASDFYVTNDKIILLGTTKQKQIGVIAFERQEHNPEISFPDVELVDFDIYNISFRNTPGPFPGFSYMVDYDVSMTIKNSGNETINSVSLFDERHFIRACAEHPFYQFTDGFELTPGQEILLETKRSVGTLNNPDILEVCYELMAPNKGFEFNLSNNKKCKTYDFTKVPDETVDQVWKVYPNASSSHLTLEAPDLKPFHYEIFSIGGKMMLAGEKNEAGTRLDISHLPAGIYFIRLQHASEIITIKFFRQ